MIRRVGTFSLARYDIGEQGNAGIGGVHDQVVIGHVFEVGDKGGLLEFAAALAAQAVADAPEKGILAEAVEVGAEVGGAGREVTDGADHDFILGGHVEDPLVVLQQAAALDLDRADDAKGFDDGAVTVRERGLVHHGVGRVVLAGVSHAARAEGIEEVDVGVDDRDRVGGRHDRPGGRGRGRGLRGGLGLKGVGQAGGGKGGGGAEEGAAGDTVFHVRAPY